METFKDVISGDQLVLTSSSSFLQGIVRASSTLLLLRASVGRFLRHMVSAMQDDAPILEQVKTVLGDRIRIIKVFYLKDIDGWMTNLGHVKGLKQRDEFTKPIHFKF